MKTKTKVIITLIILFVLFAFGFIWLINNVYIVMTIATVFKIVGAFIVAMLISFWIGWWWAK